MVEGPNVDYSAAVAEAATTTKEAVEVAEKFLTSLKEGGKNREGISLLDVKNRELLAYMMEVSFLMEKMSCGESISEDPSLLRAAKHRTILERIRPIEDKMKTQIDKLIQVSTSQNHNGKTMRARPDKMEFDSDSDGENDEENDEEGKTKKYVPPKMMAVHYDEDEEAKEAAALEKASRRAMQSSLVQELRQQYSDAPEVFRDVSRKKFEVDKEKERYEEDNYVRLRMTKADRQREAKLARDNAMDDLLKFGSYMMRGEDGELLKKRKGGGSGPGGKRRKLSKVERNKTQEFKRKKKTMNRRRK